VDRVAASRYIGKSVRLRDLLVYLCKRVLDESAGEIHEQEVGHQVFGRPMEYDTSVDNTVRVHASQLRKRLEQYFAGEGCDEAWIIEIPKGNYAPLFRERAVLEVVSPELLPDVEPARERQTDWRLWVLAGLAAVLAASTIFLLVKARSDRSAIAGDFVEKPSVRLFWSQLFKSGQPTDMVLDDATIGLFQEMTGKTVGLSEYFDRSYLRRLDEQAAAAKLDPKQASALVLRRQSSYASTHFLWRLFQAAGPLQSQRLVYFARDYTFRGIKSDNVILLGNSRSNPWVEPFEERLGIRWNFREALGTYYPVDTLATPADPNRFRGSEDASDAREGYFMAALLPNLGGTGKVLIVAGTGGSAINAGADFLTDEQAVAQLRSKLPAAKDGEFPYFETLIRIKSRSSLPKDVTVVVERPLAANGRK
jgi:hypothetical protein